MWPFKYPYTNFHEINLDWILETVKSNTDRIAENELKIKLIGGDDPLNSLHPVGSIFISTENTSPASLFGGTWEQIMGRFLLAAGSTYEAGSTGGEAKHTLTTDEMPNHTHILPYKADWGSQDGIGPWTAMFNDGTMSDTGETGYTGKWHDYQTQQKGSGLPHNNMPPYLAVYMWKRVS